MLSVFRRNGLPAALLRVVHKVLPVVGGDVVLARTDVVGYVAVEGLFYLERVERGEVFRTEQGVRGAGVFVEAVRAAFGSVRFTY